MCGLDVDAGFWGDDEGCHSGFRFGKFSLWEKKLPYGLNFYFVGFVVVFEEAVFGEEL